jgi:hypothetical protein
MIKKIWKLCSLNRLGGVAILFILLAPLYTILFTQTIKPHASQEFSKTSVMITRYDGRSGGSGVILSSKRNESKVLTNSHVCEVVKNGGLVRSDDKKGMVKYYQRSNIHDLCLITVSTNFKINTVLAPEEPEIYEDATVSGHPRLLPNILTKGHFSGHEMITIMIGIRVCTPEEQENPNSSMYCLLLGGFPVIKNYEAQVISATIQPGSSGSAVFNDKGEIAGLVFAGSGDFGYGMIVPYSYVANFIEIELPHLLETTPTQDIDLIQSKASKTDWRKVCMENKDNEKIMEVCDLVSKSLLLGQ